jgi:mono/diheme cytochrome c family protein
MRKRTLLMLIVAAGVASAALFGFATIRRGFSARDSPSFVETYVAKTARRLSVPASERNATNPFASSPEVLAEMRAHFADHCAICHGNDGSGKTQIGQNLYPKAPDMRLPRTQNLTDGELYYTIQNGIRLNGMPARGTEEKTRAAGSWFRSSDICRSSHARRGTRGWSRSIPKTQKILTTIAAEGELAAGPFRHRLQLAITPSHSKHSNIGNRVLKQ